MGWYRDLPVRLSHINWYDMSNWVPWSGIEPGTTRFDSNLTSVLPLSYEYWNKSSGQSSERDIPFPQAIIVQTHPRTCRASHGVESWLYVSWLKSADNSDIYIVRMQFRLLSSGNFGFKVPDGVVPRLASKALAYQLVLHVKLGTLVGNRTRDHKI